MFLWFVAVIRDQIGEREDRFFATVFFGSGLLFVAILFAAAAVASTPVVAVRYLGQAPPSAGVALMRALSYTLLFAFGTRAAAVFLIAIATIGLRSGVVPALVRLDRLPARRRPAGGRVLLGLGHPGAARLGRGRQPVHPAPRAIAAKERVIPTRSGSPTPLPG